MRAGSLFTGCGGLDLAVEHALGATPAWLCEADPHCRAVLERHWPGVPIVPDVREIDAGAGAVDELHGGYPCQPFSSAGKKLGAEDPRHLWPEFARCIRVLRPRVVVLENVSAHLRLGFGDVLADLAGLGFSARWGVVRASDAGAPHRRARLFVVAYADGSGLEGRRQADDNRADTPSSRTGRPLRPTERREPAADPDLNGLTLQWREQAQRRDADGRSGQNEARYAAESETPADADGERRESWSGRRASCSDHARGRQEERNGDGYLGSTEPRPIQWGAYEPAIRRWEHVLGRPAPRPADDRGRLMPEFVEWMMALPEGWTDGVKRTHRLRMLGNAVVWPQAVLAIRHLTAP